MIEKIKKIIKFSKTKKGKASFFFGFYFIFFLGLFFFITLLEPINDNPNNQINNDNNENNNANNNVNTPSELYNTERLENSDYAYKITIQKNYEFNILEGTNSNDDSINTYEYKELINFFDLKRIIKNSKYLSKTEYSNETYKIDYEIKNKELYLLFNDELNNNINGDLLNSLIVVTNKNNDVVKIEYDFSNYLHFINEEINIYKVMIEYEY